MQVYLYDGITVTREQSVQSCPKKTKQLPLGLSLSSAATFNLAANKKAKCTPKQTQFLDIWAENRECTSDSFSFWKSGVI